MKHYTIDQSGKIEDTSSDTILALCSDEIQYAIKIPKRIKQNMLNSCKKQFKTRIVLRIFAHCVYLLLKNYANKDAKIVIDDEYPKHGKDIKRYLLTKIDIPKGHIQFALVGKKDPSHILAYKTYSSKLKPNKIITNKDLNLDLLYTKKKLLKFLK